MTVSRIEYLKIYSDKNGCSHFEWDSIELESSDYAPPAPSLNTSKLESAKNSVFLDLPIGWYGTWHPTPVVQWLILMSGELEFEVEDGERITRGAGDVVLLADTSGKGHQTKVLGNVAVRISAIHI